ncbi:MAG: TetR family transcriptional regulator [Actinophytocola sp.]|nr:TetR family transcriptional regulator [Actinophytocola sp.]
MANVKSRREMYAEATRAAIVDAATTLFAEHGFAATSLEDVAAAAQVTRGAVYHHFAGKQALFEAVFDEQERHMTERITATVAEHDDPWEGSLAAIDTFLELCLDPVYTKLAWQEGPAALGLTGWKECEEKYALGLVKASMTMLIEAGYIEPKAIDTTVKFVFQIFGAAGMAMADTPEADRPRLKTECADVMRRMLTGLRAP